MRTVYTVGYSGQRPERLQALIEKLGALLVDVRFSPRSRNPRWGQPALREMFGDRYVHLPEFGNAAYKHRGQIILVDIEGGLRKTRALLETRPIVLMCACKRHWNCHRADCASLLAKEGFPVSHITDIEVVIANLEVQHGV